MGIPVVTPLRISATLALLAVAAIVTGVALLAGVAWGLIVGGILGLIAAVVLYPAGGSRGMTAEQVERAMQRERGKPR